MEVLGRDSAREAYRIAIGGPGTRIVGLVPDSMISANLPLTGGRGHQTAYDWLARNTDNLELTLRALNAGRPAPARFATVVLEKD
ncbi:MAG: hypothetical protein AAF771_17150 [Pseudomonadota bacterium]